MDNVQSGDLLQVRRDKYDALVAAGADPFLEKRYERTHMADAVIKDHELLERTETVVSLAGRLMSKRGQGKVSFCDLHDLSGKIQLFVKIDVLGEDSYAAFKKLDIGDIIGVTGTVFVTRTGEVSVRVGSYRLLSKSLRPLPEKFHGLTDNDTRYRQRYVDLIVNPEVKNTFVLRSKIVREIRACMDEMGFLEVETPVLNTISGGATARPFITHHNTLDLDMYLRIATELPLKRLIVGGMEKVYEVGRIFRNEGMDTRHNPEFTSIEFYEAYADYHDIMDRTERLVSTVTQRVLGTTKITYQGTEIDLAPGFRRITMIDAIREYSGVDFNAIPDTEAAKKAADEHNIQYEARHKRGDIINLFFEEYVEEKLINPTFVMDYPIEISPLAKKKPNSNGLTERWELFVYGRELANAFTELNDPLDQRERFEAQVEARKQGDDEAGMMDEDYITALEYAMPPTGGCGMGVDRFVMLLTDAASIRDVLLFPTMKPIGSEKKEEGSVSVPASEPVAASVEEAIDFSNVVIEPLFEDQVDFETFSKSDFRAVKVLACEAVPKSKKLLQFTLDDGSGTPRTILSGIHAFYEPEELIGKTCIAIVNLPPRAMMGIESCGMLISAVHKEGDEEKLHLLQVDPHIPAGAKLY